MTRSMKNKLKNKIKDIPFLLTYLYSTLDLYMIRKHAVFPQIIKIKLLK